MKYLYLQSALHHDPGMKQEAQTLFDYIGKELNLSFAEGTAEEVGQEALSLVYIATGGTAGMAKAALPALNGMVVLVTSGSQNSLSASMETLTYLTQNGYRARLLHGEMHEIADEMGALIRAARAKVTLNGKKMGLVGKPSDWLISTEMDYGQLKEKTGLDIVEIDMDELVREIEVGGYPDSAACRELLSHPFPKAEVDKALDVYGALERLVERYGLSGVSVRCFDLLTLVKNTGCLGLSLLNGRGVFGGCEGDLPSLISMAILGEVSGQLVFQCNPSRVDKARNEIVFAHCTLPIQMPEHYELNTHFESGIGVAIAGEIPLGKVTIFKASADFSHWFLSAGEIVEDLHEPDLCRTQIRVVCDAPVEAFLNSHVGNHYLVCRGDWTESVQLFLDMLNEA